MIDTIIMSDLHIGAQNAESLYHQINSEFFPYINNMKNCDLIIISGDFFDHKLSLNETSSKYAIRIIDRLIALAKKKDAQIRILRGTRSHDLDQLDNFLHYEKKTKGRFKIINTVQSEELYDINILYLPEEYMEDKKEYYKDTLFSNNDEKYDLCFFHGTFEFTAFTNQKQESERPIKNAPIFEYGDIENKILGPVIGGHIHVRNSYKRKIYYTGSFSRWCYSEEAPKGFLHMKYNEETSEYKIKFIENTLAPIYHTISLNDEWKAIKDLSVDEKIKYIEEIRNSYLENSSSANIRINIDKSKLINEAESNIIKEYFSDKSDYKLNIQTDTADIVQETEENEMESEYEFIIKHEYEFPVLVQKGIKKLFDQDIPLDKIKECLYEDD